jgi:hypothetical protein
MENFPKNGGLPQFSKSQSSIMIIYRQRILQKKESALSETVETQQNIIRG